MKKRLLSVILLLSLLLSSLPMTVIAAEVEAKRLSNEEKRALLENPFTDVKERDWCYDAVQYVRINKIFNGNTATTFNFVGTMTRGMFVTVLGRMAGVDAEKYAGKSDFTDVSETAYYAPYVAWAAKHGITNGMGEGKFSPDSLINRQQMAAFFVRYFEAFDVNYETGENITTVLADLASVSDYAKDAVLKMWENGLLNGDGTNFNPMSRASRGQAATLCMRMDKAVETWYKEPGVPSERVRIDPAELGESKPGASGSGGKRSYSVKFVDSETGRLIQEYKVSPGSALKEMPSEEKYSKAGAVLTGYYLDQAHTQPFYPDEPIRSNQTVYAAYEEMESSEALTVTTFTQMDCMSAPVFAIESVNGAVVDDSTVTLETKDGSDPVPLRFTDGEGVTTVSGDFKPGGTYELHLADGLVFAEKPKTIRTASFSMFRKEEENLSLNDDVVYIADTPDMNYAVDGSSYPVLTSDLVTPEGGSFNYGESLAVGDIVCIYIGADPRNRSAKDTDNDKALLDPAVYVKITAVEGGGTYAFSALGAEDQMGLYEVPDNFPFLIPAEEIGSGTLHIDSLDLSMYEVMMGSAGTMAGALSKIGVGDFVTLYSGAITVDENGDATNVSYGRITEYDGGTITYVASNINEIYKSMNLYANVDLGGEDLISEAEAAAIEAEAQSQLMASDFPREAAYLLADLASKSDGFRGNETIQSMMLTDESGAPVSEDEIQLMGLNGFELKNVSVSARIIRSGSELHFSGGVQMRISLEAQFDVPSGSSDEGIAFWLRASFIEEVSVSPGVKGELTYTEVLGIPVPNGVMVDAHVDIMNFTNFDFDAEIYTVSADGQYTSQGKVADTLDRVTAEANRSGISEEYHAALQELMDRYSEMVNKETDWITLLEKKIFSAEINVYGIVIGIEASFVVSADMSIAIGSSLQYEVGKRYSFWFEVGLYTPSSGSSTMDIIDEEFVFRFYVMGKMGVRAGIKAKLYAGIGSGDIASVGVTAEMGPYIKLWGFFVYEYSKHRAANSGTAVVESNMTGAMALEFGLYFILGFEAEALGIFEYSCEFLNKEIKLLEAGTKSFPYDFVQPEPDEVIRMVDEDGDSSNGITMPLPKVVRTLRTVNLTSGVQGVDIFSASDFRVHFSSPYFRYNGAVIEASIPGGVNYVECDMTVTYDKAKQPLTNYDMSITIPLVWTNLANSELKEYQQVSVRVTDGTDYQTVWSKKVLKGQEFDLPTEAEIRSMLNWNDLIYTGGEGYVGLSNTKKLSVRTDTEYTFRVDYREYSITVDGIQRADGSTESRTFTAHYGETFDFSSLEGSGTDRRDPDHEESVFTRFTGVSTTMQAETAMQRSEEGVYELTMEPIDLSRPITGKVAEALKNGGRATADYEDESVTAIFVFSGVELPDISLKLKRGDDPSLYNGKVAEAVAALGTDASGRPLSVKHFSPSLGPIRQSTGYTAYCVELSGKRADVTFDTNCGGAVEAPASMNKLVDSLLFNLPVPAARPGYTFDAWFTGEGVKATTVSVPEDGITLYAHWTPVKIKLSFDTDGGEIGNGVSTERTVTYDSTYGFVDDEEIPFPTVSRVGYHFLGWYTVRDTNYNKDDPGAGAVRIDEDTLVSGTEDVKLYAHWRQLIEIPQEYIDWLNMDEVEYQYYNDEPEAVELKFKDSLGDFPTDGFVVEYKLQGVTDDLYNEWYSSPKNDRPGNYDIRITRPADEYYAAFDARSSDVKIEGENWLGKPTVERLDPLLVITKGERPMEWYNGLKLNVTYAAVDSFLKKATYKAEASGTITNQDGATFEVDLCYYIIDSTGETMNWYMYGGPASDGFLHLNNPSDNGYRGYASCFLAVEVSSTTFWKSEMVIFEGTRVQTPLVTAIRMGEYEYSAPSEP